MPFTFAGMSIRGNDLPTTLYCDDRLRDALARRGRGLAAVRGHQVVEGLAAHQVRVLDRLAATGDRAVAVRDEVRDRDAELRRRHVPQDLVGIRSRRADRGRAARDAGATATAARDVQPRLGMRIDHLVHGHVDLFRGEHQDAGRGAVTELRLAVGDDQLVVGRQREPRVDLVDVRQVVLTGRVRRTG